MASGDPSIEAHLLPDDLPLALFEAGSEWHRIHRSHLDPVFFGAAPGEPPIFRFDAPAGEYRVLYVGTSLSAAFVETLLRSPRQKTIASSAIDARSVSVLTSTAALNLVDLRAGGLSKIGATNEIATGPYERSGQWALKLWRHPSKPDGMLYRSKHDPAHHCAAIFDRFHCKFTTASSQPLKAIPSRWAPILRAHGKAIV